MKKQIGIIGPETKNMSEDKRNKFTRLASEIGKKLAERDAILITGGCTGVAAAATFAAYNAGGITVGTPGRERGKSVPGVTVEICTPIGVGDFLFAGTLSCDSMIVFPGDAGTIAELAIAYRNKIPLVFIKGCDENLLRDLFESVPEDYPAYIAKDADDAANIALQVSDQKALKGESIEE